MSNQSPTNTDTMLGPLLSLRRQMDVARQTPDGIVHAPPSDAELVLETINDECLASLFERVAVLEKRCGLIPVEAAGDSPTSSLAAE